MSVFNGLVHYTGGYLFGTTSQAHPLRKRSAAESGSHIRPKSVGELDSDQIGEIL